jgi:hypothetical protein
MRRLLLALAALLACVAPSAAQQQQQRNMPGMDMREVTSKAPYHPGLGDLMTAFVQPHHIKLGLAGMAQNWPLAAYELDELRETFDDVGKLVPKHGKLDIPPAIGATVKPPMDALDKAIAAKDATDFIKAYADLTAGCNACHQSGEHPMIVVKVPDMAGTAFPDQDFNPAK